MWPNARTTKIQALFSLPILSYRWASEAQESEVTLPGHGRARTCPRQAGSAPQTEYGALISKGDHKKFSPYSSFLLHPGKKEVSRKGLLKMSLISQMLLFFLKSMSLCMEKRSPPPNPKSAKSSETLHGVKSIILISFSKCLFSKSYNNCFRNGGKRTKVLLLLLFEQYAIQWLYWTCIHFRLKKTRRGGGGRNPATSPSWAGVIFREDARRGAAPSRIEVKSICCVPLYQHHRTLILGTPEPIQTWEIREVRLQRSRGGRR